jgi:hypothetical protein
VLNTLLSSARFARLLEQQTLDGNLAYSPVEFLSTCARASGGTGRDSGEDRSLPSRVAAHYLQALNNKLNPPPARPVGPRRSAGRLHIAAGDHQR